MASSMLWGLRMNEKEQVGWEAAFLLLCFLTVDAM